MEQLKEISTMINWKKLMAKQVISKNGHIQTVYVKKPESITQQYDQPKDEQKPPHPSEEGDSASAEEEEPKKTFTKEKLKTLSAKYGKKLKDTPEEHDNYKVIKGIVDSMMSTADNEGLLGYKAKRFWQEAKSGKGGHEKYMKVLELTRR